MLHKCNTVHKYEKVEMESNILNASEKSWTVHKQEKVKMESNILNATEKSSLSMSHNIIYIIQ
jgi:hypothetical protein